MREPGLEPHRQDKPGLEPGQHALIGIERRSARRIEAGIDRGVRVAEQHRIVARPAKFARQVGMAVVEGDAVAHRAVVMGVETGQQRGAGGSAG